MLADSLPDTEPETCANCNSPLDGPDVYYDHDHGRAYCNIHCLIYDDRDE